MSAGPVQLTVDQAKFHAVFSRYIQKTHRGFSESANKKAFYVSRKATWWTEKADKAKIASNLGQVVKVQKLSKSGKTRNVRQVQSGTRNDDGHSLLYLILLKRRFKRGEGWVGEQSQKAQSEMIKILNARNRSVAYIKSGWVESIRQLAPFAGAQPEPSDRDAKQIGKVKGRAEPSKVVSGDKFVAKIFNEAWAKRDTKNAFERVGKTGLQRAIDDETTDMERQIAKDMQPAADEFNRAQR